MRPPRRGERSQPSPRPDPAREGKRQQLRVAGMASVAALFESAPDRVERLYFDEARKSLVGRWCVALARAHRQYRLVGDDELARIAGTAMHGGVVALVEPVPLADFDVAEAESWAAAGEPVIVLDGIGNPHNLGAIVRTAAFFGIGRLLISDHPGSALPSDASYRVARGGMEHVRIYRASRLAATLQRLKPAYRVIGTALERARPLAEVGGAAPGHPVALVLGNEEEGLSRSVLEACDAVVTIPGSGRVQSLNVAVSAAILMHALGLDERNAVPGRP